MPRCRVRVTGVVQGVGFRWFTLRAARRLGLAGWVRNEADGSVELVAEGDEGAMERFVEELWSGPAGAAVSEVRRSPEPAVGTLPAPFEIVRRG